MHIIAIPAVMLLGIFLFVGYGAYRAVNSKGWDDSNVFNWLRLLAHCFMHPEDFARMYYITRDGEIKGRPFHYIDKDELSELVKTRYED